MHFPQRRYPQDDDLLDGTAPSSDPVAGVLELARAPAQPGELTDLDSALAAFRAAQLASSSSHPARGGAGGSAARRPGARLRRRSAWVGLATATFTSKLLAGAAAAAAVGGLAAVVATQPSTPARPMQSTSVASTTAGHAPVGHSAARPDASPNSRPSTRPAGTATTGPASSTSARPSRATTPRRSGPPSSHGLPGMSRIGLCTAWLHQPHRHGRLADALPFQRLAVAAGGIDQLNRYCLSLLSQHVPVRHPAPPSTQHHTPTRDTPTRAQDEGPPSRSHVRHGGHGHASTPPTA